MSLITETWQLVTGLLTGITGIFVTVFSYVFDVLLILHTSYPRIEGVLIGVLFAYFYSHRDKNPWVRTLAAPLTIIIDIIDIVWDETVDAAVDLYGDVREKAGGLLGGLLSRAKAVWSSMLTKLSSFRTKVKNKTDEEE